MPGIVLPAKTNFRPLAIGQGVRYLDERSPFDLTQRDDGRRSTLPFVAGVSSVESSRERCGAAGQGDDDLIKLSGLK